jgi:hypothetical protein
MFLIVFAEIAESDICPRIPAPVDGKLRSKDNTLNIQRNCSGNAKRLSRHIRSIEKASIIPWVPFKSSRDQHPSRCQYLVCDHASLKGVTYLCNFHRAMDRRDICCCIRPGRWTGNPDLVRCATSSIDHLSIVCAFPRSSMLVLTHFQGTTRVKPHHRSIRLDGH